MEKFYPLATTKNNSNIILENNIFDFQYFELTDFAALKKLFVSPVTMLDEPNEFFKLYLLTIHLKILYKTIQLLLM